MTKKTKPKWFPLEQRGSKKDFPLMPATLTLYRLVTSKTSLKMTGVKCISFLLDLLQDDFKNYVREDEWKNFCNQCYKKVKKEPDIQKKWVKEFQKRVPRFLEFCKKVYRELR